MSEPKKIEIEWFDDADPEVAAMNAIAQAMELASFGIGYIEGESERRIARWVYSRYGGDK